jgi:CheY-like chemotaxis protein
MDELKGKRIFIIEDDVTNMAVYKATLQSSGATIIRDFHNLNSVQMLINNLPIDVILLDLMLRYKLNGYEVFDEIKASPELCQIPVIAVSASDPGIEIPKARAKGFSGFIGKPIKPLLFPKQIAACLEGYAVWFAQDGSFDNEDYHS